MRRGVDPRGFALLAFGGAAGVHALTVAAELGIRRVLVPLQASVLSAWGMLATDLTVHLARSLPGPVDPAALDAAFAAMEDQGRACLSWHNGPVEAARSADMRYGERVFEIPVDSTGLDLRAPDARTAVEARFHRWHEALFTDSLTDQEVAVANARLAVTGRLPPLPGRTVGGGPPASPVGRRRVWLDGAWTQAPVWPFEALGRGRPGAGSGRRHRRAAAPGRPGTAGRSGLAGGGRGGVTRPGSGSAGRRVRYGIAPCYTP